MRRKHLILLTAGALWACRGKEREAPAPPPVPPATTAPDAPTAAPDAAPARGGPDDPLAEKLRHCPLAIDGVEAALADAPDGVTWTLTATDPAAVGELRRRAAHLVELTAGQAAAGEHGGGEGGGFMRNCPVVTRDTLIRAQDITGGVRLAVRAVRGLTAAELQTESRRRNDALHAP